MYSTYTRTYVCTQVLLKRCNGRTCSGPCAETETEHVHSLLMEARSWDMLIMNSSDNPGLTVTNTSGWSKICRMHLYRGRPNKRDRLSTAAHVRTYIRSSTAPPPPTARQCMDTPVGPLCTTQSASAMTGNCTRKVNINLHITQELYTYVCTHIHTYIYTYVCMG